MRVDYINTFIFGEDLSQKIRAMVTHPGTGDTGRCLHSEYASITTISSTFCLYNRYRTYERDEVDFMVVLFRLFDLKTSSLGRVDVRQQFSLFSLPSASKETSRGIFYRSWTTVGEDGTQTRVFKQIRPAEK